MAKEKGYVDQLRELYETYTGKELEQALVVTIRSIQNYLKEENPTTPGREVIQSIREAYAKHLAGQPITRSEESDTTDYKQKYLSLLEQYSANSNELKAQMLVMAKIQKAEMEILLSLANQSAAGRNRSTEILRRYELADIFQNLGM